jgi:hypothetical protein
MMCHVPDKPKNSLKKFENPLLGQLVPETFFMSKPPSPQKITHDPQWQSFTIRSSSDFEVFKPDIEHIIFFDILSYHIICQKTI